MCSARPALRRVSGTPKRAASCPLPHHPDRVRPPTCRPLPSRVFPSGSGRLRIRNELVKAEGGDLGGSASPSPRTDGGGAVAPSPKLPPHASPRAERKLRPPPAGLTWGRRRGFELGPRPPPLSRLNESCTPNKVRRPKTVAERRALVVRGGAGAGDSTCLPLHPGGKRGPTESPPPGHSFSKTSPFALLELALATIPLPSLSPCLAPGVISGRSCGFPQNPRMLM